MQTKATERGTVHLYSTLSPSLQALTGVSIVDDLQATIQASIAASECKSVAVIPEGPYVIPYVQAQVA